MKLINIIIILCLIINIINAAKPCGIGKERNASTGRCRIKRCPKDQYRSLKTGQCNKCTKCKSNEKQIKSCTLSTDRICKSKTSSSTTTTTNDINKSCPSGMYKKVGSGCTQCTKCKTNEKVIRKCTSKQDRKCTPKSNTSLPSNINPSSVTTTSDPSTTTTTSGSSTNANAAAAQCISDNHKPVDWYILQKEPNGGKYWYIDPTTNGKLLPSKYDLHQPAGAAYETLEPIYQGNNNTNDIFTMYNDEPSNHNTVGISYAHSKGVIRYNGVTHTGFWLVHSTPKYPHDTKQGYGSGLESFKFGQSFLCLSLNKANIELAAKQLITMRVRQYDLRMHPGLKQEVPILASLLADAKHTNKFTIEDITTLKGNVFESFAKDKHYGKDLYHDLVGPHLKAKALVANTWQNGRLTNKMKPYCKPNDAPPEVYNVVDMEFSDGANKVSNWKSTKDHSKWVLAWNYETPKSQTDKLKIFCIGGVNRQYSQNKRGGGTVCLKKVGKNGADGYAVWNAFSKAVKTIEGCKNPGVSKVIH